MERRPIRELRKMAGLTQKELADRLGISHISVSNWELAKYEPSPRQLVALANALGVPVERIGFTRAEAAAERASRKPAGE